MAKVADTEISSPRSIRDQGGERTEERIADKLKERINPLQDSSLDTSKESNVNKSRQLVYQTGWKLHILTAG